MELVFSIARGATWGLVVGLILGLAFNRFYKKGSSTRQTRLLSWMKAISPYVMLLTFVILIIGLIWTAYYLVLGIADPAQTEYATNVSQLIVSVLTVFSIIIAFYQFLKQK